MTIYIENLSVGGVTEVQTLITIYGITILTFSLIEIAYSIKI